MPDLLLELFSEEIPARLQANAAKDLERMMNERLVAAGFAPEGVKAFAGPRRLALIATGLPLRQPDRIQEKKGPRVGAPEKAIEGFLKSAGLSSLDECATHEDKKGKYYVAKTKEKGRETSAVLAEAIPDIIRAFPWKKSMRWGAGDLAWVRPLKSILCCFADEVVEFSVDGVAAGDATVGHRRFSSAPIRARNFEKYVPALTGAKVMLDGEARAAMIAADAKTLCEAQGLNFVADDGLLAEIAGLAEWPVVMIGTFDKKFLALPDEVLSATMRGHQKYFSAKDPKTGRLANKFVFVADLDAADGGAAMRKGYERVLAARLSDAWYLYHHDLKVPLEERVKDLDRVTFFEGLGSVGDKGRRVAALAREIAPAVGADPDLADKAALLAKADLTTGMVYEFPELQGTIGRYYHLAQAGLSTTPAPGREEDARRIADAIRDHYKPQGVDDAVPTSPVSVAVALADRIWTLAAFFGIEEKPTGSKDPFALRRAAIGVIQLLLENDKRLSLARSIEASLIDIRGGFEQAGADADFRKVERVVRNDLLAFFHDRFKVYLRDSSSKHGGHRHDHVDAVLAKPEGAAEDDLVLIVMKLEALEAFLRTDDGVNLAAAFKRAANILKPVGRMQSADGAVNQEADCPAVDESLLQQAEEKALYAALTPAEDKAAKAVDKENFAEAMTALASLRRPIDAFFDKVTVNAEDERLRANRLALLARFIAATRTVADLSKLEG